jgi:hypothetical protein
MPLPKIDFIFHDSRQYGHAAAGDAAKFRKDDEKK